MTIYISGPMTGHPDKNLESFKQAQTVLESKGYNVLNPHKIADTVNIRFFEMGKIAEYEDYLKEDLIQLLSHADCVLVLPGWRSSKGAKLEVAVALACGIKVYFTMADALNDIVELKARYEQSMKVHEDRIGKNTVPSTECYID